MSNTPTRATRFIVPRTAEELIEDLDTRFPALKPTPKDSIEAVMFAAGHRSLIDYLKERLKAQQENPED